MAVLPKISFLAKNNKQKILGYTATHCSFSSKVDSTSFLTPVMDFLRAFGCQTMDEWDEAAGCRGLVRLQDMDAMSKVLWRLLWWMITSLNPDPFAFLWERWVDGFFWVTAWPLKSFNSLCSKLSMKEIKTCRYETLVPKLCCVLWSRNSDFENPNPS